MAPEIQSIAVIGAGELGRPFASAALLAGYRVILEDVSEDRLVAAVDGIARANPDERLRLVLAKTVEEAVRGADLIFEAVADEMEMKIEIFTIFDKFAKPNAIFASSSSSISIAELAAVTFCPERCIGMRLVRTTGRVDVFELVRTPETSEETVGRCWEVARRMGKEILVRTEVETCRPFQDQGKQEAFRASVQPSASSTTVANPHRVDAASEKER
jgi:3-hydroxyacyl-CoA dehydrogenase